MPCVTFKVGDVAGIVCLAGRFTRLMRAECPHCCIRPAKTIHAWREVHSGYCAPDMICGRCGLYWSHDWLFEGSLPKITSREREENIAMVARLKAGRRAG